MHASWTDMFAGIFALVVIYMLVRPSSPGPDIIAAASDAIDALVSLATQA